MSQPPETKRPTVKLARLNRDFLLKEISYTQHFSHVYVARLNQLHPRLIETIRNKSGGKAPPIARVLDVSSTSSQKKTGKSSIVAVAQQQKVNNTNSARDGDNAPKRIIVGTLYKNMPLFRPFLKEYQAELVRLEAGDDDDEEGGAAADDEVEDVGDAIGEELVDITDDTNQLQADAAAGAAAGDAPTNICSDKDSLVLEDDSGRIELGGNINPAEFVTGVIVGVAGSVNERGVFIVSDVYTPEATPPRKLCLAPRQQQEPRYLAFVSGLGITGVGAGPSTVEMLVDFLSGDVGDPRLVQIASRIGRMIVGGGVIVETEEAKLCQKVKLEPHDHARLTEVSAGKTATNSASTANSMKHADRLLSVFARTAALEVMPGDGDATNCFLPQQPIHPLMLPTSSRDNAMRLVTNPFAFDVVVDGGDGDGDGNRIADAQIDKDKSLSFVVSSGQNLTDILRQTKLGPVAVMSKLLKWGHWCPSAPNSLACYPFKDNDPFVVSQSPHCVVSCCQQQFETDFIDGVRYVSVPKFSLTGQIVLVDVTSPQLNTINVTVALSEE